MEEHRLYEMANLRRQFKVRTGPFRVAGTPPHHRPTRGAGLGQPGQGVKSVDLEEGSWGRHLGHWLYGILREKSTLAQDADLQLRLSACGRLCGQCDTVGTGGE